MYLLAGNVPVLYAPLVPFGVLLVVRDITDCVDIVVAWHTHILVHGDTAVIFQLEARLLQETRRRSDAGTHDDEISGQVILALDGNTATCRRIRRRRLDTGNLGLHDKLDALLLHILPSANYSTCKSLPA